MAKTVAPACTTCVLCPPAFRWTTFFQFLRDWRAVILRDGASKITQSHAHRPEHVVQRERRLDELYSELLNILAAHVPVQNRVSRRRQPSWWNSDCLSACIARNGALRDHRRTPSAESHARFRSARHAFHRTIRTAQRAFWSNWQDQVSALSVLNPRVVAATVRRTRIGTLSRCGGQIVLVASFSVTLPHTGGSISHQLVFTRVLSTKISSQEMLPFRPTTVPFPLLPVVSSFSSI